MQRIGTYDLQGELARGAMGVVYRAHDAALDRHVAVKVIRSEDLRDPESQLRFRQELKILARLRHPHIVGVHSAGSSKQGYPFVAMDLIEGGSLHDRLQAHGPLPLREAARYGVQLADALHYAHEQGVLHRDVKPQNVLLEGKNALLTDFGLAKVLGADAKGLTQSGDRLGTPLYMAPEQALGENHRVGPHTDVYALGVTLYCTLSGEKPFTGTSVLTVFESILSDSPPPLRAHRPEIDRALEAIVLRCLEKDPADRFPTAAALRDALAAWLTPAEAERPPLRRGPRLGLAIPALALGVAIGLGAGVWVSSRTAGSAPAPATAEPPPSVDPKPKAPSVDDPRLARAQQRLRRGDGAGALEDFEAVVAADPTRVEAWVGKARVLLSEDRGLEAVQALSEALRLTPDSAELLAQRGRAQSTQRPEKALADLTRSLELAPNHAPTHLARAEVHLTLDKRSDARRDAEQALTLDPRLARAEFLLGELALAGGDSEGALRAWERALLLSPADPAILVARGGLRQRLGQAKAARADYTAAIEGTQSLPEAFLGRAETYREPLGHTTAILADLDVVKRLAPKDGALAGRCAGLLVKLRRYRPAVREFTRGAECLDRSGRGAGDELRAEAARLQAALDEGVWLVTADPLNMRAGAGTSSAVLRRLAKDTRVRALRQSGGWVEVEVLGRGAPSRGWVSATYLALPLPGG